MSLDADHQPSNTAGIEDSAAHFLARRRFGDWQPADQADLDHWLGANLSHRVAFWRLEATLVRTERLAALQPSMARPSRSGDGRRKTMLRVAAVAAIAFAGLGSSYLFLSQKERIYATPVGGHKVLKLADGSTIELNTNTVVRVDTTQRLATLERGEAYFQIKHDAAHPFVLQASGHLVIDLGTKFLVRSAGNKLEVSLVEGLARIQPANSTSIGTVLTPGDVAIATGAKLKIDRRPAVAVEHELGWRHGVIVFDNTTLADAAVEFNRYNTTKLVVADSAVGRMTIGATFPAHDVERFARAAHVLLGVRLSKQGDDIVISR